MRIWLLIVILIPLGAALAGAQASPAGPARFRIPTRAELERCPKLAAVDWKKVRRRIEKDERRTAGAPAPDPLAEHRMIRGPRPLPDLSRAEIVLDVAIGPGETQEYPTSTSSFVWKEPGGAWQLDRVDQTTAPPAPEPPGSSVVMDQAWNEAAYRPIMRGPLDPGQAQALDRLLSDPCFAAQPDVVPWRLPMKKGPDESCSGAIGSTLRIRTPAGTRYLSDPCGRGYGYEAASLVMYGTLDRVTMIRRALARALGRADFELADLKRGKSFNVSELVCGSVSTPGSAKARFTWQLYMRGPYPEEQLTFERDSQREGITNFEQYWQARCGDPPAGGG